MRRTQLLCLLALLVPSISLSSAYDEATWSPEAVQADFESLYRTLRESHFDLYANRSKPAYEALYKTTRDGFQQPMPLTDIQSAFQRFVAFGNVAHARIDPPVAAWEKFRQAGGKAFPLFLRVCNERVFVQETLGEAGVTPGQEVLSIDGVPALKWLGRLRKHVSADSDYLAFTVMENSLPLLVWLEFGELASVALEVSVEGAAVTTLEVPTLSRADLEEIDNPSSQRFTLDWNRREARFVAEQVAYLRPGPFYDNRPEAAHPWDPTDFQSFIDDAFTQFNQAGATQLLIDLRNNPGGSNGFSDHLLAWFADRPFRFSDRFEIRVSEAAVAANRERLSQQARGADAISRRLDDVYANHRIGSVVEFPVNWIEPRPGARFRGRVYILVNRHTYSNAVSVAAIAQDYGFGEVLGETTADLVNTYGGMEHFSLPITGIRVGFPKARILRPNGNEDADVVVPDFEISVDIAPSHDAMLEQAMAILAAHS